MFVSRLYVIIILFFIIWQNDSEVHIHWKGAAEIILASCTGYLDTNGCLQSIDKDVVSNNATVIEISS